MYRSLPESGTEAWDSTHVRVDAHEARQRGVLMTVLAAVPAVVTLAAAVACAFWAPLRTVFGVHPAAAAPALAVVTALPVGTALVGMATMRVAALFAHFAVVVGVTVVAPSVLLLCFHLQGRRYWDAPSQYCVSTSGDSSYDCSAPQLVPAVLVFVLCFVDTVFGVCFSFPFFRLVLSLGVCSHSFVVLGWSWRCSSSPPCPRIASGGSFARPLVRHPLLLSSPLTLATPLCPIGNVQSCLEVMSLFLCVCICIFPQLPSLSFPFLLCRFPLELNDGRARTDPEVPDLRALRASRPGR